MVTMKKIAELSGVSRGTVDRVLNNRGGVSPETAAHIRRIAKESGYTPNEAAKTLSSCKKDVLIDYILFNPARACFFKDVENGVKSAASEMLGNGCSIRIHHVDTWETTAFLAKIDEAVRADTDGLAIVGLDAPQIEEKLLELKEQKIPVVTANTDIPHSGRLAFVGSNAYHAGQIAADIVQLLFREPIHLGIVLGFRSSYCHTERIRGLTDALQHHGLIWDIQFMESNNDDEFDSFDLVQQQMLRHPDTNLLFLATGSGAFGACRALEKLSKSRRPCVIGFDATDPIVEMLRKHIITATITQDPFLQGTEPIRILSRYLTLGESPSTPEHFTDCHILFAESL